jgi:hypothetical protein
MRLLPLLLLGACTNETGTIQLELTTAPGSTVIDGVQRLRVTLTDPPVVVEAPRVDDRFDLVIDVEATGTAGSLIVEGFDDGDSLVATGASPPFAVSGINARVVIYLAAPFTIGAAPVALPAARIGVASTPLSYGFAVAGGETDEGIRSDSIFIYNSFDHTLVAGIAMPAPRSFQTLATGSNNGIYLFGGLDSDGAPTGSLWRFDTNVQPSGAFSVGAESTDLAREGASAVSLLPEHFVISGTPPINLDFGIATARTDVPALDRGAGLVLDDRGIGVFAGDPVTRLEDDIFESYPVSTVADTTAAIVGTTAVFTTDTTNLLVLGATATTPGSMVDALSAIRHRPAIAATASHVVVAGGTDDGGLPIATADILDAVTLERITTVPCVARAGASAYALPNGQIAIVGGAPANAAIELFTPPPPR